MREVILDFETSYDGKSANIWLWTYATVEDTPKTKWGLTLLSLLEKLAKERNTIYYYHNLSFDGIFILSELFNMGFTQTMEIKPKDGEFYCSFMNNTMYSIRFKYNGRDIIIRDSLKVIPLSVEQIPKAFGLSEDSKGIIDYTKIRPNGYIPTRAEIDYGIEDTVIVAKGLHKLRQSGLKKFTSASNALTHCKELIPDFDKYFPKLENSFISDYYAAYKGGLSFGNKKYLNQVIENGLVLDVNSEYPWAMEQCPLPYGYPVNYKTDLFFIKIKCKLYEKENCPQFLFSTGVFDKLFKSGDIIDLTLTSVDYYNMHKYYHVEKEIILDVVYFESKIGVLKPYIDYWREVKINAELEGNMGMRYIAKLMLNSLYGKFGAKWFNEMTEFHLDEEGVLETLRTHLGESATVYMPLAAFVTAWGRDKLLKAIYELQQQEGDNFLYCDTDSIHMKGYSIPTSVKVDDTAFGCWKIEFEFKRARYIHSKCYIEEGWKLNSKHKRIVNFKKNKYGVSKEIKCCGLPNKINRVIDGIPTRINTRDIIGFDDFVKGAVFKNMKLKKKNVNGGCYLENGDFTIR